MSAAVTLPVADYLAVSSKASNLCIQGAHMAVLGALARRNVARESAERTSNSRQGHRPRSCPRLAQIPSPGGSHRSDEVDPFARPPWDCAGAATLPRPPTYAR